MKRKYFATFEDFFQKKEDKEPRKKLKHLKPIENFEEKDRKEQERYNQIEDIGKRGSTSHNIKEETAGNPNGVN